MFNFNNLHKNQTWAFIDGVLVGLQIGACLVYGYIKLYEMKSLEKEIEELLDEHENTNP